MSTKPRRHQGLFAPIIGIFSIARILSSLLSLTPFSGIAAIGRTLFSILRLTHNHSKMQRRQATLKEKLSEHYQKRDFKAKKETTSYVAMSFFGVMAVTLLLENLILLLPNHYRDENGRYKSGYHIVQVIVVLLFIESVVNWWHSYYDVQNRVTKHLKPEYFPNMIETPPGWKNCPTCMIDAPPRSHHCSLCNHCILKRDHHCFFTGSCIGFHNQRSFVIYCFYCVIATSLTAYMQLSYLNQDYPIFSSAAVFYFPLYALWQFVIGAASFGNIFILLHFFLTAGSLGTALFFLTWHITIIVRGQTSYEAWKNIMIYRRRIIGHNLYSVFGSPVHFAIRLFLPIALNLPEDGVKWEIDTKSEKGQ